MITEQVIDNAAFAVSAALSAGYTQTEIAKESGYSQPTVAQVMRRSGRNSQTTRNNIMQAALKMAQNPKQKQDYSRTVESFRRMVHPAIVYGFSRSRLGVEAGYNEDYIPYLLSGHGPNGRVPDIAYRRVKKVVDEILNGSKTADQPAHKPGNSILHSRKKIRETRRPASCQTDRKETLQVPEILDALILHSRSNAATAAASSRPEH